MKKNITPRVIFKPKLGQTDYTRARWAPVMNCIVMCRGKMLIVERSRNVGYYPGVWNGISGFLDDRESLEEKVRTELREEVGIRPHDIIRMEFGDVFDLEDPAHRKTWVVHPVKVFVRTLRVVLNDEAQDFRWVTPQEAKRYRLMPGFRIVLKRMSLVRKTRSRARRGRKV